jgi:hypothetical protein
MVSGGSVMGRRKADAATRPTRWRLGAKAMGWMCALLLAVAAPAGAHESEQYTLPAGRDFADLGPLLSRTFLAALREAVADTNAAIDAESASGERAAQLQRLQSAEHIAGQVWARLFVAYPTNELLDLGLISTATRARYPGLVTMYRPVESIYDDALLMIDVSKPVRALFRAGTVSAGGVLFGTDKIIHFINVGRIYHLRYVEAVVQGMAEADATRYAVQSTADNPLLSEDGLLGLYTTGIRSNGDLAADYAGLKFYRNLSEPVQLGDRLLPPLLERDGPYWRLAVHDEDTVFTRFVSAHWNEVLNPNSYLDYVGNRVRSVIASRCDDVADWYRDVYGQPLEASWFAIRQQELSTYFGEPYGHALPADDPVSVSRICHDPARSSPTAAADVPLWWGAALPPAADDLGRSPLWWAADAGRADQVERLAASGAPADRPDADGERPLHAAARHGHVPVARLLLARGADANRPSHQGQTPLLLATAGAHVELGRLLLQAGADPNAQDRFGRTPLLEAAQRGDQAMAALLLRHGADATVASKHGTDALQAALRGGHEALFEALRGSAPVVRRLAVSSGLTAAQAVPQAVLQNTPSPEGPVQQR